MTNLSVIIGSVTSYLIMCYVAKLFLLIRDGYINWDDDAIFWFIVLWPFSIPIAIVAPIFMYNFIYSCSSCHDYQ